MDKPILLDLFCGAGGASMGYHNAGFRVVGVDIEPQKNYPFEFYQEDAFEFMKILKFNKTKKIHAIHASPPCQAYSKCVNINGNEYPDLIGATREVLKETGKPYIIENVPGAKNLLVDPIMLCGAMFEGLRTYRHRFFETNFDIKAPEHPKHIHPQCKMGRKPKENEWMHIVGNFIGVEEGKKAMGIDWMVRSELKEAIPPLYTEYIGSKLKEIL